MVCDRESKICMIHRCENCPGIKQVQQFLHDYFKKNYYSENLYDNEDLDYVQEMEINFKQWTKTDRTELVSMKFPVNEFLELLAKKLDNITTHSYIARAQSSYLK